MPRITATASFSWMPGAATTWQSTQATNTVIRTCPEVRRKLSGDRSKLAMRRMR